MVQTNVVVIGWNRAVAGREGLAGELFAHTTMYFDKQKSMGNIESWQPVFLQRHGGDLNGFFLVTGTHAQLDSFKSNEEFLEIQMRADHCLQGFGVIDGYTGKIIPEMMNRWIKTIPSR